MGAARHQEPQNVAEVVAGIGQERHRMSGKAEHHLGHDEAGVERDTDHEGAAEIRRRVAVAVAVRMAMMSMAMAGVVVAGMVMIRMRLQERDLLLVVQPL